MLAKVYLTREDYQNVVKETSEVMQMGYKLWKNYADNFDVEKKMDRNLYLKSSISGILRVCRVVITTDIIVLRLSI